MSFPRYPEHRPIALRWPTSVPAHWEVSVLKHQVDITSGGTPSKENAAYWHGDVPWASSKDLKVEQLEDTEDHITRHAVESGAARLVPSGSVLVVTRGMILAHTFPVAKTACDMAINQFASYC